MESFKPSLMKVLAATLLAGALCGPVQAAKAPPPPLPPVPYADLADLADSAPLVLRAEIRKQAVVEPARATGVRAGKARLYVEARTKALLFGTRTLGESLRYLVDVPLDSRGKVPSLGKKTVLLFARSVANRPGELQLVQPDAQVLWDAAVEERVRGIVGELIAPGAPGRISGVREAIYVPGTLAGEGETQLFLATPDGEPAAITVHHRPGEPAAWSASFSEVLEGAASVPPRDSLSWYRLACFLPPALPQGTNLSESAEDRAQAAKDYAMVITQLGDCPRLRR
ncbi:MAG: hypothetical protein KGL44_02785 [Sphingomonadales bacterium]|nr:hypothetical protein [Sphingomonadales bacterium]